MWPSASSGITTTSAIDSRQGSSLEWCSYGPMNTTGRSLGGIVVGQVVAVVELGRDAQAEDADQLVDRAGARRSRRRSRTVSSSPPTASRMIRRASSRSRVVCRPVPRRLGVGVGVAGQHLVADEVLDERQRPPGRGVVGVGDPARTVRARASPGRRRSPTRGCGAAAGSRAWVRHGPHGRPPAERPRPGRAASSGDRGNGPQPDGSLGGSTVGEARYPKVVLSRSAGWRVVVRPAPSGCTRAAAAGRRTSGGRPSRGRRRGTRRRSAPCLWHP